MTIVLEYEKVNPCDFGPETYYKVIEVKDLTKKERTSKRRKPKKVLDILTEIKETLFDNGDIIVDKDTKIKFY